MNLKSYFIIISLFSFRALVAQNELSGKIKNQKDNLPLVGASVFISDLKLGAISDAEGSYIFRNMPQGAYLIEVSRLGFASQTREVDIDDSKTENFDLHESRIDLKEVIVTGFASATEKQSTPIPVSVINQKDMLQSSATNIIDALSNTPGVSQITEGPAISKPIIRGLGYNRVVVINDGIRQEGQQWGDEFGIEVDEYSVNRVEVYKGPASLRYGSDAMAGVINMLAAPAAAPGTIKGNLISNYQTNNGLFANSLNIAGNKNGLTWDLRYTNKQAHAYQNRYDGYVWNSGYTENNLKGTVGINRKWGYSHITASMFNLKLGIIEGARDATTGQFIEHLLGAGNTDSTAVAPRSRYLTYNYFPIIHQHVRHYKMVWDNNIALRKGLLGVRLGYQENYRQEANDITIGNVYNNYFFLRTGNYDLRYVFPEKNKLELSAGANGMVQASEDRGTVFLVPEYNFLDLGLFVLAKKTFEKYSLSGGVRFDTRMLHGKNLYTNQNGVRISGPQPNSTLRFAAYNSDFAGVSASLGYSYEINKYFYYKLNVSRGYRAPNIAESGSNGVHDGTPFYEIGNPKLKPETSLQGDFTVGVNTENISIELNTFVNNINNYIFPLKLIGKNGKDSLRFDPLSGIPPSSTFKYVAGDAVLSGGETVVNIHPQAVSWLSWFNSFSMVNAIQKNQPDSSKYLPYTPPYKFRTELRLGLPKEGGIVKNAYFKVSVDHFFEQTKVYYKFGNETITPAYTLVNAGLGADICKKEETVCSLFIYCSNLGDVAYQSNMSRLKYADTNGITGRVGVFNMGRNISFKVVIPLNFKR